MDRGNALVRARVIECIDDVLQHRLWLRFVQQLGDRTIERITLQFLDDHPDRLDQQCRTIRQHGRRPRQCANEYCEQQEQQQQMQQLAKTVDTTPDPGQQPDQQISLLHGIQIS
jgi:hypothetical protein